MKDNPQPFWKRGLRPACDAVVCAMGIAACVTGVVVGLEIFKYFFALAVAGGLAGAAIACLGHRKSELP